jgi:hypothetical protein
MFLVKLLRGTRCIEIRNENLMILNVIVTLFMYDIFNLSTQFQ